MSNQKSLVAAMFVGHGSPMLMIEENPYTPQWSIYLQQLPYVKAVVSISAHWVTCGIKITTNTPQKIIYDFYGFPQDLYDIRLTIPGSQKIAYQVATLLKSYKPILTNEWGLDHGTWSVIYRVNPQINIPVIQLSIDHNLSMREHFELAKALRSLREQNILLLGSGNVVHNLKYCRYFDDISEIHLWAIKFQENIIRYLKNRDIDGLLTYIDSGAPEVSLSIASREHFIPLIYVLAQARDNESFELFNPVFALTALDMLCVAISQ